MSLIKDAGQRREFLRYLVSGFSAMGTDLVTYTVLLHVGMHDSPSAAKTFSFIAGTCVAYLLNKFWTFKKKAHSWAEMFKFGGLYSFSLLCNVAANKLVLFGIQVYLPALEPVRFQLAWLCATGTSTILNYIGQKFWVFKHRSTAHGKQNSPAE